MKKTGLLKLLLLAFTCTALSAFVACGGGDDSSSSTPDSSSISSGIEHSSSSGNVEENSSSIIPGPGPGGSENSSIVGDYSGSGYSSETSEDSSEEVSSVEESTSTEDSTASEDTSADDAYNATATQGLEYTYVEAENAYTLTGIGEATDTEIRIPTKYEGLPVVAIANGAFSDNTTIISVTIPDSIKSIGNTAFFNCSALVEVVIGVNVESIMATAFSSCVKLTSITVSVDNANYQSIDGNLYSKDGTTLVQYAIGKTDELFTVSDSVETIGADAFRACTALTSIVIGEGVTSIGVCAFEGVSNLTSVYYKGASSDAWDAITVDNDQNYNDIILNATRFYYVESEADLPDDNGSYWYYGEDGEIVACATLPGIPEDPSTQGLAFTYLEEQNAYEVAGIGEATDTEIRIPVTYENLPVIAIGADAFRMNDNITNVFIPEGVTRIGHGAFYSCDALLKVSLPASLKNIEYDVFAWSGNLVDYEFRGTVEDWVQITFGAPVFDINSYTEKKLYIGGAEIEEVNVDCEISAYAFYGCKSITKVTIPDGVEKINQQTFYGCTNLAELSIGADVTTIDEYAFLGCGITELVIPNNVTTIGYMAFAENLALQSVVLGEGVEELPNYLFNCCMELSSIQFGSNLKVIGESVFYGCSKLTNVEFPTGLTSIGSYAFRECVGLEEINIPDSVESLGTYAFFNCSGAKSINIGNGVTTIGQEAFRRCSSATTAVVGSSVTEIVYGMFSECKELTSVQILGNVISLGKQAFFECSKMESIILPDTVETIGEEAFSKCYKLKYMVVGSSLSSVGSSAFNYCNVFSTIFYKGTASDWDVSVGWYNTKFSNATKFYYVENETDLTGSGVEWHFVDGVPTLW